MDNIPLYDKKHAGEELERQVVLRSEGFQAIKLAANVTEEDDWAMNYQCMKHGPVWKLVTVAQESAMEEVVVSLQGIIYSKDIAPFSPKSFYEKPNIGRFLRQSLTLCGLQTPTFEKASKAILQIHALLARSVGQDNLEDCPMISKDDEGDILLHMSNRYLTPKKEIMGATKLAIPSSIDPNGYLSRVAGQSYFYTDENQVHFFERRRIPGTDDIKLEACNPVIFRVGDIVEAQVTFIIIPMRDGKKKTSMVLRSLLLLDGTITQKSMVAQILQQDDVPKVFRPLKRRVGYGFEDEMAFRDQAEDDEGSSSRPMIRRRLGHVDEGMKETTKKMSDMDIDAGPSKGRDLD